MYICIYIYIYIYIYTYTYTYVIIRLLYYMVLYYVLDMISERRCRRIPSCWAALHSETGGWLLTEEHTVREFCVLFDLCRKCWGLAYELKLGAGRIFEPSSGLSFLAPRNVASWRRHAKAALRRVAGTGEASAALVLRNVLWKKIGWRRFSLGSPCSGWFRHPHQEPLEYSEGGMIRLETLIEFKFLNSIFSSSSSYWN